MAREDMVAHWTQAKTWVNIGSSMVDVFNTTNDAGLAVRIDFANKTQVAAEVQWDKIGSGTQTLECVDVADVTKVLFTMAVVSGNNVLALTAIPAHFLPVSSSASYGRVQQQQETTPCSGAVQ